MSETTETEPFAHGYAIVAEEAVGDRSELPHRAALFDIDSKYGDVVSLDTARHRLMELGGWFATPDQTGTKHSSTSSTRGAT